VQEDPTEWLPPLSELGHSRETLIALLGSADPLAAEEIGLVARYANEIESDILAVIERAGREELDEFSAELLFKGIHILGGRRLTAAYRPFLALLHGVGAERVVEHFGDAIAATLARIFAGLFDGDPAPLETLIADESVDEFVRNEAIGALAFLTFEGRIERMHAEDFLDRLERDNTAPPGHLVWHGWMVAVGLLGIENLAPRVHAAFEEERIPQWVTEESDFRELLAAAKDRPADYTRFEDEGLGYIEDIYETLKAFEHAPDEDAEDDALAWDEAETSADLQRFGWLDPALPEHNPFRGVGRNDPCPCGSGKKFKRCCLS
jgi:hypothetical protein